MISDEEVIPPTASLEIVSPILTVISLNEKERCVMSKEIEGKNDRMCVLGLVRLRGRYVR